MLLGIILVAQGVLSAARPALADVNVNLYAGSAMLAFGVVLLGLAYRRRG